MLLTLFYLVMLGLLCGCFNLYLRGVKGRAGMNQKIANKRKIYELEHYAFKNRFDGCKLFPDFKAQDFKHDGNCWICYPQNDPDYKYMPYTSFIELQIQDQMRTEVEPETPCACRLCKSIDDTLPPELPELSDTQQMINIAKAIKKQQPEEVYEIVDGGGGKIKEIDYYSVLDMCRESW